MNSQITKIKKEKMFDLTNIELKQRSNGRFVPDIPSYSVRSKNNRLELLTHYFFKKQNLYISRHNRFAAYPLHTHQFTELNYMLSGSCTQLVNGKPVTLRQGQLLLIGVGAGHQIEPLGEGDLLINILFNKHTVPVEWLNQMKDDRSPLIDYLFNLVLGKGNTNVTFTFSIDETQESHHILNKIITEYSAATPYASAIASLYLPILFSTLAHECSSSHLSAAPVPEHSRKIIPVLQMIEENYKDINLSEAAARLGYNKTYLGQLIKKETGVTFTQLVLRKRLYQARLLLNTTDLPISDIARESGFSNKTYFYKVFRQSFGYLPGEEKSGNARSGKQKKGGT